jgi:thymidylate synthase
MRVFSGDTANEAWLQAAGALCQENEGRGQPSRAGATREILHAVFTISDPTQRWVVARTPPINPAFAIAEVIWILRGRNDAAFVNYWNSKLPEFAGNASHYHGAYGYRLRQHFGFDQLDKAYTALRQNPESRQVALQIWDPATDLPDEHGNPADPDIPCNVVAFLKVRNGRLEWLQVLRSNDLVRGVPYNFVQFTTLQEVMAGWLGLKPGGYNHLSDSLHLYERDYAEVASTKPINPEANTDSLGIPRDQSEVVFGGLASRAEALAKTDLTKKKLADLVEGFDAPRCFHHLLLLLAAEAARRRKWRDCADQLMRECKNPALTQVWARWLGSRTQ